MARLRWGDSAPTSADSARSRLVDAAEECFRRYGVAKTTVEDVATVANVSRATVYRYFDGRDALILGVLEREGSRFMRRLQQRLGRAPNLSTAIVDGTLFTVKAVKADEHLAMLFAPEAVGLTVNIPGATDAMFKLATAFLRPLLEAADAAGQLRPGLKVDEVAEWILRTVLSLLTAEFPVSRSAAEQRRFLEAFLVAAIVKDDTPAPRPRRSAPVTRTSTRRTGAAHDGPPHARGPNSHSRQAPS